MQQKYSIITTTCKNKKEAKSLAEILIKNKLVACAQINAIDSLYLWENKIQQEKEYSLSLKSKAGNYKKIEQVIIKNHSYKTPQIVQIAINSGSKGYFDWIEDSLK